MGTWYEIDRVPYEPWQPAGKTCTEAQYFNLDPSTGYFDVKNSDQSSTFGTRTYANGTGYAPDGNGWVYVHFGGPQPTQPNYKVISTDYTSYAVVYGCIPEQLHPNLWCLSRTPAVSSSFIPNC